MERRQRALPIFLIAGFVAVLATALPLFSSSLASPPMQIRYTKVTSVKMPGIMRMFARGAGAPTTETLTIGPTRVRTDNGDTSQILQCDLKRIVHLDNKAKTYWVKTFDQMMTDMQNALKSAQQKMKTASPQPQATATTLKGSGGMTIDVNDQPDSQTQTILGMTAHHIVETLTMKYAGTGDCKGTGELTFKTDQWYIPNEIQAPACPIVPRFTPAGGPPAGAGGPNMPCMANFRAQAGSHTHPADRFVLKEDLSMSMPGGAPLGGFGTHEEVTAYQKMAYDPALMDVPAGYAQVQAPQTPY